MVVREVVVTRKGQVTIPVEIRRKLGIEEGVRLRVWSEGRRIIMEPVVSIYALAGSGAGKASPEEMKRMLDELREEDFEEESV